MADVSISDLGDLTPSGSIYVPISNSITTGKAQLSALPVDYSRVTSKPSFAAVATSGSYNDLSNKPSIPSINNLQLAKAWVNFNGTGSVGANQTIRSQYNISTVNKLATGQYRVTFSSAMANSSYVVNGMAVQFDNSGVHTGVTACWNFTTTYFDLYTETIWIPGKDNAYFYDSELVTVTVFGS